MSDANTLPKSVHIDLKERSYDIRFCPNFDNFCEILKPFIAESIVVISNKTIWDIYGKQLVDALKSAEMVPDLWLMGDGEKYKSVETTAAAWDFLIEKRYTRRTCIVAFGGGVVGDLAGFVASSFLRGVPFVQVPTTVVSMVDSSVGGKTGVDHPMGKNLIGAFYQPKLVAIMPDLLKSLDSHNLHGGFAEVIKYGVIYDAEFFGWLETNLERAIALEVDAIEHVVRRSCEIKADVVSQDEFESGLRAILNYGHTFAHAIEALGEYEEKQFHGQAVAIGMCCAADLAVNLGMMPRADAERIEAIIERAGLPRHLPAGLNADEVYRKMFSDKKVAAGKIRFILPTKIGEVKLVGDIPREKVISVINARIR